MPIDLDRIPTPLLEAAKRGSLVPFIGAGISRHAKVKVSRALPTWTEFIKELEDVARGLNCLEPEEETQIDELVVRGKYLMAAQALKQAIPEEELEIFIKKRFTAKGAEPGPIHRAIFKLASPLILTTNYDLLLERAYAEEFRDQADTATPRHFYHVQRVLKNYHQESDRPLIFKIHGTADRPSEVVFSEMDYRKLIYGLPGYRAVLSSIFVTRTVLMLGFSFSDPELTVITESLREWFNKRSSHDYIVLRKGEKGKVEKNRLRQDFGLEVIEYDPSEGDPELLELVDHLASFSPMGLNKKNG